MDSLTGTLLTMTSGYRVASQAVARRHRAMPVRQAVEAVRGAHR